MDNFTQGAPEDDLLFPFPLSRTFPRHASSAIFIFEIFVRTNNNIVCRCAYRDESRRFHTNPRHNEGDLLVNLHVRDYSATGSVRRLAFTSITLIIFRFDWKKSWRTPRTRIERVFVRFDRGQASEAIREKSIRNEGEEGDERIFEETTPKPARNFDTPPPPLFLTFLVQFAKNVVFPRGGINNEDTSFYRIVRANQSQVADRDLIRIIILRAHNW